MYMTVFQVESNAEIDVFLQALYRSKSIFLLMVEVVVKSVKICFSNCKTYLF